MTRIVLKDPHLTQLFERQYRLVRANNWTPPTCPEFLGGHGHWPGDEPVFIGPESDHWQPLSLTN